MVTEDQITQAIEYPLYPEILSPGAKLQAGLSNHGLRGHGTLKKFDLVLLEELAAIQCTVEEIAAVFKVHRDTIFEHQKKDPEFAECLDRGRLRGKASLRRRQIEILNKDGAGAGTMAVWLGKNILGQRDFSDVALHSPGSLDVEVNVSAREEITRRIARIAQRAGTGSGS